MQGCCLSISINCGIMGWRGNSITMMKLDFCQLSNLTSRYLEGGGLLFSDCFTKNHKIMSENTSLQSPEIEAGDHQAYLKYALSLATKSPPKPTNYRVGALLVDASVNAILSTGYTMELPGNTHAEQCCFEKLAAQYSIEASQLANVLPEQVVLYTTMEPCSMRLSGNLPCVDRILGIGSKIKIVYVGVEEPEKFVSENSGRKKLEQAGVKFEHIGGLEKEIFEVATTGHEK